MPHSRLLRPDCLGLVPISGNPSLTSRQGQREGSRAAVRRAPCPLYSAYRTSFRRRVSQLVFLLPWIAFPAGAASAVATQTLAATISPAWTLSAPATASLARGQQAFQPFQVTVPVNYEARTTPSGSGKITLQVAADFSPTGGPSASSGALTFTCSGASLGSPCSGTQTASTTNQSPILTLPASACTGGGGLCSGQDPNLVNLTFTLTDDPSYSTGSYAASITFTISAI